MKLYTESQVRKAIDFFLSDETQKDKILKTLIPIELPSDEEIEKVSNIRLLYPTDKSANFRLGAKWIKEQILNQNK